MRTVTQLRDLERGRPAIVTIGAFDGVHRGHQYLIRQVVDRARFLHCAAAVITFDPRPEVLFRPGSKQLTNGAEKVRIMTALGVDTLAVLPFTEEFSRLTAGQFLVSMMDHVNLAEVWIGADFAFGHKRQGNADFLVHHSQQAGYAVHVIPRQSLEGQEVSSSRVRALVEEGDVEGAALLLGHFFGLNGPIVGGHGRGTGLGFPTANLQVPPHQQLPATGVYAAFVRHDGETLLAAVNVGYSPVFAGQELRVEAFILDWSGQLYGASVGLDFVARLREERNFDSVAELVTAIRQDVERVREILASATQPGELILS